MTVRDVIQEELEDWNEEHQDNLIEICQGDHMLCCAWVEDSKEALREYMDIECDRVSYYSEATCIYIEEE